MKNFDFKRFGQVLKNDLCEARLHYITWGCALLATLVVAYTLLIIKLNYLYTDGDVTRLLAPVWLNTIDKITRVIGTVLLVGCALWVPTSMTANFATRGRCIAALSLPASTGEKFASRLVVFWLVQCQRFVGAHHPFPVEGLLQLACRQSAEIGLRLLDAHCAYSRWRSYDGAQLRFLFGHRNDSAYSAR